MRWLRHLLIWFAEDEHDHLQALEIIAGERMRQARERGNNDLALYHFERLTKITHRKNRLYRKIVQLSGRRFAYTERG